MSDVHSIIHIDPEILGGKPVFISTRVPVETLFEYLETSSLNDFLEGFQRSAGNSQHQPSNRQGNY
jgi:uncharacterized protein (DUF433 family)